MSIDMAALYRKATRAVVDAAGDTDAAVDAVLPDILEAAAKVADWHYGEQARRIAVAIRALADDTENVQSSELLKKEAKQQNR